MHSLRVLSVAICASVLSGSPVHISLGPYYMSRWLHDDASLSSTPCLLSFLMYFSGSFAKS